MLAFLRRGRDPADVVLVALNFTPVPRHGYRVGVPHGGRWREALNGDAADYGRSGVGNLGEVAATAKPCDGQPWTLRLTLPPLAALFVVPSGGPR